MLGGALALISLWACTPANTMPDVDTTFDVPNMDRDGSSMAQMDNPTSTVADGNLPEIAPFRPHDFTAQDSNANSPTNGQPITLSGQYGSISVWYFATATCHFCTTMVEPLARMQREIAAMNPPRQVRVFIVADLQSDGAGQGIVGMIPIPLVQDNRTANVQATLMANLRDVVVIDQNGDRQLVYNLNTRPLTTAMYYDDLKARLLAFAR
jgi:hypothetical protein